MRPGECSPDRSFFLFHGLQVQYFKCINGCIFLLAFLFDDLVIPEIEFADIQL